MRIKLFFRSRWRLARATESLTKEKPSQAVLLDRLTQLEQSRPRAASEMANELMLDTEEAVRLGVFNNQWEKTIMTASVAGRVDLIETGTWDLIFGEMILEMLMYRNRTIRENSSNKF